MKIETVDDLAETICDWVGCYGTCDAAEKGKDCTNNNIFCCRVGAMMVLPDRIRAAVENEEKLKSADFI